MPSRLERTAILAGIGLFLSLACLARGNPDALWEIVNGQCVPAQLRTGAPVAPCVEVGLKEGIARGYMVMKDRRGVLQHLLIPTARVTGIEDPAVLAADAPDYWGEAWRARAYLDRLAGHPVDRTDVSLTINPVAYRSQNQLHIHISCVRPAVKSLLASRAAAIGSGWTRLADMNGRAYLAMKIRGSTLDGVRPFQRVADTVPGARASMGKETLAVVGARFADGSEGFYLLAGNTDDTMSAEHDVQDHDCAVLK